MVWEMASKDTKQAKIDPINDVIEANLLSVISATLQQAVRCAAPPDKYRLAEFLPQPA